MIKGTTKSGFNYELEDKRLNNFELLEIFADVDRNPLLLPKALDMLLGKEQKDRLYNHLRDEDGIVPTNCIVDEIKDIFSSNQEIKN